MNHTRIILAFALLVLFLYGVAAADSSDEMPKACQDLNKAITDAWHTSCGNSKYNVIADITNDGNVDVYDLSKFADNAYDEKWCTDQAKDDTDPCKKAASYGKLKVTSNPSKADVYLDGRYAGITPLGLSEVSPGTHTVEVKLKNYNPYKKAIKVSKNRTIPVHAKLTKTSTKTSTKKSAKTTDAATAAVRSTCADSDDGINYVVKGTVRICTTSIRKSCKKYSDSCSGSSGRLVERYCNGNKLATANYDCPNGCKNEACIKDEEAANCADSDSGKDYYVKGIVTGTSTTGQGLELEDQCEANGTKVHEYFCKEPSKIVTGRDNYGWVNYDCPNGCSNGVCNPLGKCSADATACTGLNYNKPLCGNIIYSDVWNGYEFTYQKTCSADEGGGQRSGWSFEQPGCAVLNECSDGCEDGVCVGETIYNALKCSQKYYQEWHTSRCNAKACESGSYVKCENKRRLMTVYYREVCERSYYTGCQQNPACNSGYREIVRGTCAKTDTDIPA